MSFKNMKTGGVFVCPKCGCSLVKEGNSLLCENRHCYDIAKSGYVNLLLSQSASHGDGKLMVNARRDFLSKGHYSHLRSAICSALSEYASGALLDAGCGEGYYTSEMSCGGKLETYGVDISREALALAAKVGSITACAAASVYHLPVANSSCGALTSVFSPFCSDEFSRVLEEGGILINVVPREKHLWEMKCAIYDTPYENTVGDGTLEGFELLDTVDTDRTVRLGHDDAQALFTMTPYFYRTSERDAKKLELINGIEVTTSFRVFVYRKRK